VLQGEASRVNKGKELRPNAEEGWDPGEREGTEQKTSLKLGKEVECVLVLVPDAPGPQFAMSLENLEEEQTKPAASRNKKTLTDNRPIGERENRLAPHNGDGVLAILSTDQKRGGGRIIVIERPKRTPKRSSECRGTSKPPAGGRQTGNVLLGGGGGVS